MADTDIRDTQQALSANLKRLRSAQKMSQTTLAKRAGLSRVGYRNIETGVAEPRPETLTSLARALGVSLAELVSPVRELRSVRFRARKKMTSREQLLADVARWVDNYVFLEELVGQTVRYALLDIAEDIPRRRTKNRPIRAAEMARHRMGLGETETIRDICGLLEDNGVKVYTPQVASEGFFGLSLGAEDGGPAVVVNTWDRVTVERWIFTAAHELGHLLLHADAYDVSETEEPPDEEREADVFASHFLMPQGVFEQEWHEARGLSVVHAVLKVKAMFRVSWKTVVYRLAENHANPGRVWASFYAAYKREMGRSLKGAEEPRGLSADDFRESPSPVVRAAHEPEHLPPGVFQEDRLGRLVRKALDDDQITLGRAAELLDLSVSEMRALASAWF